MPENVGSEKVYSRIINEFLPFLNRLESCCWIIISNQPTNRWNSPSHQIVKYAHSITTLHSSILPMWTQNMYVIPWANRECRHWKVLNEIPISKSPSPTHSSVVDAFRLCRYTSYFISRLFFSVALPLLSSTLRTTSYSLLFWITPRSLQCNHNIIKSLCY